MNMRLGNGDASLTTLLSRQSSTLKSELTLRTSEMTTGRHSDMAQAVGGDFSALAAVDHSLARLKGYAANTIEAGLFTDTLQSALGMISDGAGNLGNQLLNNQGLSNPTALDAIASEAGRVFGSTIAALNTRFSDRALFSGVNSQVAPLPDADAILTTLQGVTAGAVTAADVETAIADWFSDPLGYEALYAGGAPRSGAQIAPGETADLSVTALDPALRDTVRDLATAALLGRGVLAGQPQARASLAQSAGSKLLTGGDARAHLMARVGTVQAQIAAADSRNSAEDSALSIIRAGIVSADPYDTASRLQELQTQLEALYLITARVSRLSLAEYI
ncbi:MAG: flagellar biosynthesis protein FlgL [Paracoccaceae bacterium]